MSVAVVWGVGSGPRVNCHMVLYKSVSRTASPRRYRRLHTIVDTAVRPCSRTDSTEQIKLKR